MINSALVSAQSRKRLYWTNIPNVQQPADRGILLKDILESGVNLSDNGKSYCLTSSYSGACAWNTLERNQRTMIAEPCCVSQLGRYADSGDRSKKIENSKIEQYYEARIDGKTNALTTVEKDNNVAVPLAINDYDGKSRTIKAQYQNTAIVSTTYRSSYGTTMVAEPIRIGTIENNLKNPNNDSKQYRVYSPFGKSTALCAEGGGLGAKSGIYAVPLNDFKNNSSQKIYEVSSGIINVNGKIYPIKLADGFYIIRLLSVLECKRLQTVPDDYKMPCSKSQNYKMLGNGWTIDVISHILSYIPNIQKSDIEVFSMYDGMSCGHISLDKLGCNVVRYFATEIDKYAIKTTYTNYPETIFLGDAFNVRKNNFKVEPQTVRKRKMKILSGEQIALF